MPIEIRELVIRTVVGGDNPAPSSGAHGNLGGHGQGDTAPAPGSPSFDALVQECVRQVMLALARERDR